MKKLIVIGIISVLNITLMFPQAKSNKELSNSMDSVLTACTSKNMLNASILVAKKGEVLISKGYGIANSNYNLPNKADTKFKLASVSKQFTAACIMLLEEQGKLSVNDPLSKYAPDFLNAKKITIHQLLNHTSGIQNATELPEFDTLYRYLPTTDAKQITQFKNLKSDFEPGTKWNYSNSGYIILSYIIEKVSGTSYENFVEKNIFEKLGMKNSGYYNNNEVYANVATGYTSVNDKLENVKYIDMSVPSGAGSLYSTVEDLYVWYKALMTNKLLKKESFTKMTTPWKEGEDYGYGLMVGKTNEHKWIMHSGGIEGFATVIVMFPEDDLFIAVLSNVDNYTLFNPRKTLRAIAFGDKYEMPMQRVAIKVDPKTLDQYVGNYELMPGFVLSVTTRNGAIYSQATGQSELEIFPEAVDKFFLKQVAAQLVFNKDEKGKVTSVTLFQGGQQMPGKKIN